MFGEKMPIFLVKNGTSHQENLEQQWTKSSEKSFDTFSQG